ncbi:hypothetical protein PAJ_2362 [Pantoea ananatis AJ13355]|uniref:Uncharacterized protein n=1 Tax=Pantoea ananatis (strain AJ13355) TaxID=932677 RepID=A0A0H3L3J4_PANAA|nr:hypothetical protein PAJ_2362 [Pantoea ananatis AJ13355]
MASRTSVTSENITVAPLRTSRSEAKPTAGFAVTPEKASLPPHCMPTTSSEAGQVSRWRWLSRFRCRSATWRISSTMAPKPTSFSSCKRTISSSSSEMGCTSGVPVNKRSGCSFSQPRLTTMISPPKFALRARLWTERIGITAAGALIATPQP